MTPLVLKNHQSGRLTAKIPNSAEIAFSHSGRMSHMYMSNNQEKLSTLEAN